MIHQMPVAVGLQKGGISFMVRAVTAVRDFGILRGMNALSDNISYCKGFHGQHYYLY